MGSNRSRRRQKARKLTYPCILEWQRGEGAIIIERNFSEPVEGKEVNYEYDERAEMQLSLH